MKLHLIAVGHKMPGWINAGYDDYARRMPPDLPLLLSEIKPGHRVAGEDGARARQIEAERILAALPAGSVPVVLDERGAQATTRELAAWLQGWMAEGVSPASVGANTELPVRHHPRKVGVAKYGLERTVKVVLDLFTVKFLLDYSHKPMRLFGGTGVGLMFVSFLLLAYLFIRKVFFLIPVLSSPFFQIGVMLLILGFQSILMGLIAELLARTYHESQSKPTYTIRAVLGKK